MRPCPQTGNLTDIDMYALRGGVYFMEWIRMELQNGTMNAEQRVIKCGKHCIELSAQFVIKFHAL